MSVKLYTLFSKIIIAVIFIAPYLTYMSEHTALYKIKKKKKKKMYTLKLQK